jgi:hypothetical protein
MEEPTPYEAKGENGVGCGWNMLRGFLVELCEASQATSLQKVRLSFVYFLVLHKNNLGHPEQQKISFLFEKPLKRNTCRSEPSIRLRSYYFIQCRARCRITATAVYCQSFNTGKALVLWYLPCSTIGDSRETRFSQKAKRLRCTVAGNSPSRCCRRERVEAVGELMGNEGYVCD